MLSMMKKILSSLLLFMGVSAALLAQSTMGELKGEVKDDKGEPVPFATVVVEKDGVQVRGDATDIDGKYWIKSIPAGTYNVLYSSVGYQSVKKTNVRIEGGGNITFLNSVLGTSAINLTEVLIQEEKVPLITKDETTQRKTITRDDIVKLPSRDIYSAATTVGGVFSRDGEVGNVRGSRAGVTVFVDGVKIRGAAANLPQQAVEETQIILGGVPASFGDATGGLILVTTRAIPNKYFGAVEARTSKFLDNWEDYLFSGALGGPLIKSKKSNGRPIAGFLATVEGNYVKDPAPVAGGVWKVKDDVKESLLANPIRLASGFQTGTRLNSEFLTKNDFEKVAARQNVASMYVNAQGKLDFNVAKNTTITVGGFVNASRGNGGRDGGTYDFSLFNWENNAQSEGMSWNVWGRITQRFEPAKDTTNKSKAFRNALVSLQVDYLQGNGKTQNGIHGDNFFNYGYIGKYDITRVPTYAYGFDPKLNKSGFLYTGLADLGVDFTSGNLNPTSAAINNQYFGYYGNDLQFTRDLAAIQNFGGLLNGFAPRTVYSMWSHVGTPYNGYSMNNNNQFRIVAQGSVAIKDHDIQVGFEFEQRTDNAYSVSPVGLWTLARLYTNSHLGVVDTSNPMAVYDNLGIYQDTINYNPLYQADPNRPGFGLGQSFFDYNLRQKLGLSSSGTDILNVDALDPSFLSLNMFSADELLNQGNNLVSYYGYDAYGNQTGNSSFEEFFTARDQFGNYTRPISSFQPNYLAGYIMDKFSFKDIIFNVGVRVDRFDANQKVLKDRYSLYEAYSAGNVSTLAGDPIAHPGNIGDDYMVYVNDLTNPTAILGYRNGDNWYNANGEAINDPTLLRTATGRVQPYVLDPSAEVEKGFNPIGAFTDYTPQVNVMPRIAFSFPISDNVQFTAYYDILTQRPGSGFLRNNPLDYYFWNNSTYNGAGTVFNNPNLRPERTTDFSLGFRQRLTESSALKISAFYRELRDMIAVVRVNEAYPRTYKTYDNIDFGTVKGITFEYELRQSKNFKLSASYTLQFADGTGSDNFSQLNLVNSGQPNLRIIYPTNYDRRHLFTAFFIYRFGDDKDNGEYIGPKGKFFEGLLKNLGASLTLRGGSGVPYSRQVLPTGTQVGVGTTSLQGSLNGARLPWEFNLDLMVDKDINIFWGKKDAKDRKKSVLNIYIQVLNLLDNRNTISVYGATGSATDDGFLTSPLYETYINSQVDPNSFRDFYSMKVQDPRNFSLPRRVRLGAILSF
jgi:hypothetical protein